MNSRAQQAGRQGQQEVIEFLGSPETYGNEGCRVERIETHGAIVFLTGKDAYKIKKALQFSYMDFSTLERRRLVCQHELEINRPHAPDLYLGVIAITRRDDGALEFGGRGEAIEWAVHMRRFPPDALLSTVVERGALEAPVAGQLADAIFDYHRSAQIVSPGDAAGRIEKIIFQVTSGLQSLETGLDPTNLARMSAGLKRHLAKVAPLVDRRERAGFVRRCHGDLHLGNIVLWYGRPTLFDAIEFDEEIATTDTMYDLAFLLMDLDQRDHRAAANIVLNRYLWRSQELLDLEALAALPLFLGLRAAIRGMVQAQRAGQASSAIDDPSSKRSRAYLEVALGYLQPVGPRLVAVGGLSGTGKSTLAAALAPRIGSAPGAVHLRSDLERKAMFGVGETDKLPAASYSADVSNKVYERLFLKADTALSAGQSVVVDAVFLHSDERQPLEKIAQSMSLPFQGLWLAAPLDTLVGRVAARSGDASDATADVVRRQFALDRGVNQWRALDASGTAELVKRTAFQYLAIQ